MWVVGMVSGRGVGGGDGGGSSVLASLWWQVLWQDVILCFYFQRKGRERILIAY